MYPEQINEMMKPLEPARIIPVPPGETAEAKFER
jgi:hypothetical protein